MNKFNLFRVNCLINDHGSNSFNKIIISLISEHQIENQNQLVSLEDIYKYLVEFIGLKIDFDYLKSLINKSSKFFEIDVLEEINIHIKLTDNLFIQVRDTISTKSIEYYIKEFLHAKGYEDSKFDSIISLLFCVVSENINTFSSEKIIEIINQQIESFQEYKKEDILIFNEFLEYQNSDKNKVLYAVFQKAVEFAILTSGKGVASFNTRIFNNKTYLLDTNIIFRLLGVGGQERQESLISLLKECISRGISLQYTTFTYKELRNKLTQIVNYLKAKWKQNGGIEALGNLYLENPSLFDGDFITHYASLKKAKIVDSPDDYEHFLKGRLRILEKEIGFKQVPKEKILSEKKIDSFANYIFKSKKDLKNSTKYSLAAAKIDAYNVLQVRELRGQNNINYSDVKSFYLTTDRSLNKVLSIDGNIFIPETILPSQLFILHHNLSESPNQSDYELFIKFIKKRTSNFSFNGKDVLDFHKRLVEKGINNDEIEDLIKSCLDTKFEKESIVEFDEIPKTTNQIIDYVLNKKLKEVDNLGERIKSLEQTIEEQASNLYYETKKHIKWLDFLFMFLLIPLIVLFIKTLTDLDWWISLLIFIIFEVIKFVFSSKFKLINKFWLKYINYRIERSPLKDLEGESLKELLISFYNNVDGDPWKVEK
ncbi:MAG: hypothetical protein LCH67_11055 [Bacteroidetes bacterium]|nr:hypothetical protein [Bacteroidota bacterium]